MRVGTPDVRQLRAGLHFFRWGAHLKLRRGSRYRHLIAKVRKANRFGNVSGRELWVGWWMSDKGIRKPFNGLAVGLRIERFAKVEMSDSMDNPVYPTNARERSR